MPIVARETRFDVIDGALVGGNMRFLNTFSSGLVTLILVAKVENSSSETARLVIVNDSWDRDTAFVGPGQEGTLSIPLKTPGPVRKVSLIPIYAEFDNGDKVGPAADTAAACLLGGRRAVIGFHSQLLGIYQLRGEAGVADALRESTTSHAEWLRRVRQKRGIQGVISIISGDRHLKP